MFAASLAGLSLSARTRTSPPVPVCLTVIVFLMVFPTFCFSVRRGDHPRFDVEHITLVGHVVSTTFSGLFFGCGNRTISAYRRQLLMLCRAWSQRVRKFILGGFGAFQPGGFDLHNLPGEAVDPLECVWGWRPAPVVAGVHDRRCGDDPGE